MSQAQKLHLDHFEKNKFFTPPYGAKVKNIVRHMEQKICFSKNLIRHTDHIHCYFKFLCSATRTPFYTIYHIPTGNYHE